MPLIPVLSIYSNGDALSVETVDSVVQAETPLDEFSLSDLAEISAEHAVCLWAAPETQDPDTIWPVVQVGYAEAVITREDVERSYHSGTNHLPMVNIKVYETELPKGEEWAALVNEFELDPKLAAVSLEELRNLVEAEIERDQEWFELACTDGFEMLEEDAKSNIFPGYPVKCWAAGRQGGWFVVEGLPDVDFWGPDLLAAWAKLRRIARSAADNIPRAMAWLILANYQDRLADRVRTVTLRFVLADTDVEAPEVMANWDWHSMLDLSPESTVTVLSVKDRD